MEKKLANEIEHGKYLLRRGPAEVWNRQTPAGKVRWARRVEMLASFAAPSMAILEIGCGTGELTKELVKTGAQITAIDISEDLLNVARSNVISEKVIFKNENAYDTKFPSDFFDAIVGSSALHHLEIDRALKEFYRILKIGGLIFFTEPNMMNPQIAVQKNIPWIKKAMGDSPDETAFFRWSLKDKLKKAGFREIKISPFDFLHPAIPVYLIDFLRPVCETMEKVPLLKEISGSLYIVAKK